MPDILCIPMDWLVLVLSWQLVVATTTTIMLSLLVVEPLPNFQIFLGFKLWAI
jgi:hypothetical protein